MVILGGNLIPVPKIFTYCFFFIRSFCLPTTEEHARADIRLTEDFGSPLTSSHKAKWCSAEGNLFLRVPSTETATDPAVLMNRATITFSPENDEAANDLDSRPTSPSFGVTSGFSKHWVKSYRQFAKEKATKAAKVNVNKFKSLENYEKTLEKLRTWTNQMKLNRRKKSIVADASGALLHYYDGVLQPPTGKKDFHEMCNPRRTKGQRKICHANLGLS
jgi:hypothetical protein